ncbi:Homeobox protein knotted-1-like, partial [Sarracenia purpurea var. burkii]
ERIMDDMYGLHSTMNSYADNVLMSPENNLMPAEYYQSFYSPGGDYYRTPVFGSDELISAASAISEAASITPGVRRNDEDRDDLSGVIKAKIASHPFYPRLLEAYIDCQKVAVITESDDELLLFASKI